MTRDGAVRGLDVAAFDRWLRRTRPDLVGDQPLSATLLTGGRSNLTYRLDGGPAPLVLRRPPLAHVQATAHDMRREHTVIAALAASPVPVPAPYLLQEEADAATGVDTPFYLMQHVAGAILATPADNAGHSPAALRALSLELATTLASLHRLDPASVGLGELGRPEGFLPRQLRRWSTQLAGSRSRELPQLDALVAELAAQVPQTSRVGLVHGDYRLDNVLVQPVSGAVTGAVSGAVTEQDSGDRLRVAAVLDWEMATVGDTATDLGLLGMYWGLGALARRLGGALAGAVDPDAGYPSFAELVEAYRAALGADDAADDATDSTTATSSLDHLPWYLAFAAHKLAIILEGVHHRFQQGATVGDGFDTLGALVEPLARAGRATLAGRSSSLIPA